MLASSPPDGPGIRAKKLTLVLVTSDDYSRVLLGMKKRGFG